MIPHLHLVLPNALTSLRANPQMAADEVLTQWLIQGKRQLLWRRDDLQHAHLDPWQQALLTVIPPALRSQGLASANLTRRGAGADWQSGSCLHVEPLHLLAGMSDLSILWPPALSDEEEQELLNSLQPLISLAGFELHRQANTRGWFMSGSRQFNWLTYSPRSGYAGSLYDLMPTGDRAAELRRLMSETQMLLHDHPVNHRRNQRGVPGINALWFWGDAPLELVSQPLPLHVISNEPYVKGLCEHLHQACWPVPDDLTDLLDSEHLFNNLEHWLLVLPERDIADYAATLKQLNDWLESGRIRQLHVYLDQWRIDLHGGWWSTWQRRLRKKQMIDELLS